MKRPSPLLSSHSWFSPGSIVPPLVGAIVAGDSGATAGVSGPVAELLGASARAICASPVLVGGEDSEKHDVMLARGAAAACTDGFRPQARSAHCDGSQQLPPCWYRYPYWCVRVLGEWCPQGVILWSLIYFRRASEGGGVFNVPPVIKVTDEKKMKKMYPRVCFRRACYSRGVCYHPCYTVGCCCVASPCV